MNKNMVWEYLKNPDGRSKLEQSTDGILNDRITFYNSRLKDKRVFNLLPGSIVYPVCTKV